MSCRPAVRLCWSIATPDRGCYFSFGREARDRCDRFFRIPSGAFVSCATSRVGCCTDIANETSPISSTTSTERRSIEPADPVGLRYFLAQLHRGKSFSRVVEEIEASPEATERRTSEPTQRCALDGISDGEFILGVAELLFASGGATAKDIEYWTSHLGDDPTKRSRLVQDLIFEHIVRQRQDEPEHDPHNCMVMGTRRYLTPAVWRERAAELAHDARPSKRRRPLDRSRIPEISSSPRSPVSTKEADTSNSSSTIWFLRRSSIAAS